MITMKTTITILIFCLAASAALAQQPTADEIMERIDDNMHAESRIVTSRMVIHARRGSRTIESKTWARGEEESFTEYLAPAREKGIKMLMLEDKLWMYSPSTDRTIQISGHMLRQSVMGSDLSYEDMMEDPELANYYDAAVSGSETVDDRDCWILDMTANTSDVAYHFRKVWVDKERYIPLRSELYAKSGKLLKKMDLTDIVRTQGRWYPRRMVFKDVLKTGMGTEFLVDEIEFDVEIPGVIFSKASLRR
jgi:outer membrane lipoprotein-sorting protein